LLIGLNLAQKWTGFKILFSEHAILSIAGLGAPETLSAGGQMGARPRPGSAAGCPDKRAGEKGDVRTVQDEWKDIERQGFASNPVNSETRARSKRATAA
jgi:hypothetical protein